MTGIITTAGEGAIGAYASGDSYFSAGSIETEGANAHGVQVLDNSGADVAGSVRVGGLGSYAAYAKGSSDVSIGGSIASSQGGGAYADDNSSVYFAGDANVTVVGDNMFAFLSSGDSLISNNADNMAAAGFSALAAGGSVFNITGDMKAENGGAIDLTMADGSLWNGASYNEPNGTINLDMTGTAWNLTDASSATNLAVGTGTNVNLSALPFGGGLYVDSLSSKGGGGTFTFATDVVNEQANRLTVGGTTSGAHKVAVVNNGSVQTTGKERVKLIETADKGGDFTLAHNVELGAYVYGLRNKDDGRGLYDANGGQYWELYAAGGLTPDSPPSLSSSAQGAIDTFIGSYYLNYVDLATLIQRLGDLRATENKEGAWFRAYGGKIKSDPRVYASGFDMDYYGLQAGYDHKLENSWFKNGDTYVGAFVGLANGDFDFKDYGAGSGNTDNKSLGMYATFIGDNGFYVDGIAKYVWSKSDFSTRDTAGNLVSADDETTGGAGLSLEVGRRIRFGEKQENKGRWYIEPQLQLAYQRMDEMYFTLSNGLKMGMDDVDSLLGRAGVLLGYETENTNFYAKASFVKEFKGDIDVWYEGGDFIGREDMGDNWWVYGIGVTHRMNEKNSLYFSLERADGGDYFTQDWAVYAGWRITF
jgi:outer membrane autotransporter protein